MTFRQGKSKGDAKRGASLLGYGLLVGLISVVSLTTITTTGSQVGTLFGTVGGELSSTVAATGGGGQGGDSAPAATPTPVGLASFGGYRAWADGSLATSCHAYLNPVAGFEYSGTTGDGTYRMDPDGTGSILPVDLWCDMTSDGGGWTLVHKTDQSGPDDRTDGGHNASALSSNSVNTVAVLPSTIVDALSPTHTWRTIATTGEKAYLTGGDPFRTTDSAFTSSDVPNWFGVTARWMAYDWSDDQNDWIVQWDAAHFPNHSPAACPDQSPCISSSHAAHMFPARYCCTGSHSAPFFDYGLFVNGAAISLTTVGGGTLTSPDYTPFRYLAGTSWVR